MAPYFRNTPLQPVRPLCTSLLEAICPYSTSIGWPGLHSKDKHVTTHSLDAMAPRQLICCSDDIKLPGNLSCVVCYNQEQNAVVLAISIPWVASCTVYLGREVHPALAAHCWNQCRYGHRIQPSVCSCRKNPNPTPNFPNLLKQKKETLQTPANEKVRQ